MHAQRKTAHYLVEDKHADYIFTAVKDNQPKLFEALDAMPWAGAPIEHVMKDRAHGRDEVRTIQVLPALEDLFPYAAQALLICRTGVTDRAPSPQPRRQPPLGHRRPRHHQRHRRTRRADAHSPGRARPLGHRKRHLRRGRLPCADPQRVPEHGRHAQPGHRALRVSRWTSIASGLRWAGRDYLNALSLLRLAT